MKSSVACWFVCVLGCGAAETIGLPTQVPDGGEAPRPTFDATPFGADGGVGLDVGPPDDAGPIDLVVEVRSGDLGPCTRTASGRVRCQPSNAREGPTTGLVAIDSGAQSLSVGGTYTWHLELVACARMATGTVRCATNGAGLGDRFDVYEIPIAARSVSVGRDEACAVVADGRVVCWSIFYFEDHTPRVVEGIAEAVAVSCSTLRCCALDGAGDAWCWQDPHSSSTDWRITRVPLTTSSAVIRVSQVLVCVIASDLGVACVDNDGLVTSHQVTAVDLDVWGGTVCWLDDGQRVHCFTDFFFTQPVVAPARQIDLGAPGGDAAEGTELGAFVCALEEMGKIECRVADFFGW